jgi:hypothetical protein
VGNREKCLTYNRVPRMKKYICPKIEVENLGMESMLAESLTINDDVITSDDAILTNGVSDKNVWDEEW